VTQATELLCEKEVISTFLRALVVRGARLKADGDRLLVKPPPGGLGAGEETDLREYKPDVMAWLGRADLALADALAEVDRAESLYAGRPAMLAVAGLYRETAREYRERLDPLLFETADAVRKWVARQAAGERGGT